MALKVIILGLVQGLTEFLPVSSSGHLVIGQHLLGFYRPDLAAAARGLLEAWPLGHVSGLLAGLGLAGLGESELMLDVALHVGTLAAVVFFLRREVWRIIVQLPYLPLLLGPARVRRRVWAERTDLKLAVLVVAGTIPTGLIGILFKNALEAAFTSVIAVGFALIFTGWVLGLTAFVGRARRGVERFGIGRALLVGLAQGLAITPGISRSGTTIAVGLFTGLEPSLAVRFSFLLSIPAILGALALHLMEGVSGSVSPGLMILGAAVAAVVGYLALALLVWLVGRGKLWYFAPYCILVGLIALFL
jgi:undecaprenyl-diphosphatase